MAESVLITGVAGFIGSQVARRFMAEGYRVFGVDDLSSGSLSNVPPEIEFINADLSKKTRLPRASIVLHLAGQSSGEISFEDPVSDLEKNTISCLNLIEYAINNKCERLVYASSMSVYGAVEDKPVSEEQVCIPLSCYGIGKLAAEHYLKIYSSSVPTTSLRMFNVYGPGQDLKNLKQGMVSIYLAQAIEKRHIVVRGSDQRYRDFIYIDDVVNAWFSIATKDGPADSIVNLGTGRKTKVRQLLDEIQTLLPGTTIQMIDGTPGDQFGIYASTSKLNEYLPVHNFIPIADGLKRFLNQINRQS